MHALPALLVAALWPAASAAEVGARSERPIDLGIRTAAAVMISPAAGGQPAWLVGSYGIDLSAAVGPILGFGASVERLARFGHDDAIDGDTRAELFARLLKRRSSWEAGGRFGAGYLRTSGRDEHSRVRGHGVTLLMETEASHYLSDNLRLGGYFHWSFGCYVGAERTGPNSSTDQFERPVPGVDVSCLGAVFTAYTAGVRTGVSF